MMNHKKIVPVSIGMVLVLLAGCGLNLEENESSGSGEESTEDLVTVRYAGFAGVNGLPIHYGIEQGIFEEKGLHVEFVETTDPVTALASNEVDIAEASTTGAIIGAGQGAPLKIVSSMYRSKGPFYLISTPDIESVEDLKGKNVGIGRNGIGLELYTREILSAHGVEEEDVTFIANGAHQDAYSSLINGQVDATIIHEPFASLSEQEEDAKLLAVGWEYLPTFHTGVLAAQDQFIEEDPEVLESFIEAYFESAEYAKEHKEDGYIDYVLSQVELDETALRSAFEREDPIWENNPDVDEEELQDTQELQLKYGFQDEIYDVSEILDLQFIPKGE